MKPNEIDSFNKAIMDIRVATGGLCIDLLLVTKWVYVGLLLISIPVIIFAFANAHLSGAFLCLLMLLAAANYFVRRSMFKYISRILPKPNR